MITARAQNRVKVTGQILISQSEITKCWNLAASTRQTDWIGGSYGTFDAACRAAYKSFRDAEIVIRD